MSRSRPESTTGIPRYVLIYVRVSTTRQAREGFSLDDQTALTLDYCNTVFGAGAFTYEVFREEGRSGQKRPRQMGGRGCRERQTLSEMIDALETGRFTDVVCNEVSRSSRDVYFWQWFKEEICRPLGITLRFRVGDLNCDDEDDEFFADMQAMMGQREARANGRRIRDAQQQALLQGYWPYPKCPWGWMREPLGSVPRGQRRKIIPDPAKAPWLIHMKDRLLRDGWGLKRIATEMQEKGIPSGGKEPRWSSSSVWQKLTHTAHAGYLIGPEDQLIEGVHRPDALWDLDTYHQIRAVLADRRPDMGDRHRANDDLLAGIVTCAHCGRRLRVEATTDERARFYACVRSAPGDSCPGHRTNAPMVETLLMNAVTDLANSPTMSMLVGEEADELLSQHQKTSAEELERCQEQERKLDGRLTKLATAFTDGLMTPEQFQKVSHEWQEQLEGLRARMRSAEDRLAQGQNDRLLLERVERTLRNLANTWQSLPMPELRDFLSQIVEHVTIAPDGNDRLLRVKLLLLPEQEFRIPSVHRRARGAAGAGRLTLRELSVVAHLAEGLSFPQIADVLDTSLACVHEMLTRAKKETGIQGTEEIIEACRPRFEETQDALALHGMARQRSNRDDVLSPRQRQVWDLKQEGKSNAEIAEALVIAEATVRVHLYDATKHLARRAPEELVEQPE